MNIAKFYDCQFFYINVVILTGYSNDIRQPYTIEKSANRGELPPLKEIIFFGGCMTE
jgi:hypothetical protein